MIQVFSLTHTLVFYNESVQLIIFFVLAQNYQLKHYLYFNREKIEINERLCLGPTNLHHVNWTIN